MKKPLLLSLCFLSLVANGAVNDSSLDTILDTINKLESKKEPKCYATASRLEDFMFGTPLSDEARFSKNNLQTNLVYSWWQKAGEVAKNDNEQFILASHIEQVVAEYFKVNENAKGHFDLRFFKNKKLQLHKDDKRQYSTIAYSLRAVLAVQQEALLSNELDLMPLSETAVTRLSNSLDFYTLAALKVADNQARLNDSYEVNDDNINFAWDALGNNTLPALPKSKANSYQVIKPELLFDMTEKKLASYAAYNKVSNPVFMRNLQVYFARVSWPKSSDESNKIERLFSQLVSKFSSQLYSGAQKLAMDDNALTINEAAVHSFSKQFIPHTINEYEDALFFPNLSKVERVYVESYDMDAFRDAGVHWVYLNNAITADGFSLYLEPDPFAAELIVENIAQYAVLLLRVAGMVVKESGKNTLSSESLKAADTKLKALVLKHSKASEFNQSKPLIASVERTTEEPITPFNDVTASIGIQFEHRTSDWLNRQLRSFIKTDDSSGNITVPPAFGGSGVAVEDINADGVMDVLLLGGRGNRLFLGDNKGIFTDITAQAGLSWQRKEDNLPGEVRQPIIADINNDGLQDIIITYVNDTHRVYKNVGNAKFEDVTKVANLGGVGLVGGPATVFDYDNDGDLDLYITYFGNYITGDLPTLERRNFNGKPNQLFENKGDFKFENVTKGSGLNNVGWAQAVAHTDLNNDGWQDVIVGNDFGVNGYYINKKNGSFTESSNELGTYKPSFTMGIGITDLNQDLLPDVYISNIVTMNKDESYVLPNKDTVVKFNADKLAHMRVVEANDLFISNASESNYVHSKDVGRGYSSTGWSWDADFFDYDLDGDDDLYVLNGMNEFNLYSSENPYFRDSKGNERDILMPVSEKEENIFFENNAGKLTANKGSLGLNLLSNSRSASYFDYDNDGDLDIIINNFQEPAALFQNNLKTDFNWLKVKLVGSSAKKVTADAIGARIYVTLPNGKIIWREIRSTDGYMSVHPKQQHFGLGKADTVSITIKWPNGQVSSFDSVKANQALTYSLTN